ncbi:uncharacterized protein LOC106089376 [Stomoxys calcitrans]|uniref:DUF4706 domain-containing protein n=1 Tax=Stomoxys calcitrans TaxID=35570 RepID=A0A1I8PM21_STOCA|nr:uncharacterized protein LOC106089376 [Stomoxys calcitrans]
MPETLDCTLDVIQEYFAKLNPIAERIYHDINDTKLNYGKLWESLSTKEQSDIINDTLIKPEISLRYFDNFPTPTQSNSTKSQTSTDSLAAIVLNDFSKHQNNEDSDRIRLPSKQFEAKYSANEGYAFDGRDLRTFSIQQVALKIIHDEALGSFRDEYSRPFSYRTKSQINLHLFPSNAADSKASGLFQRNALPMGKDTKQEPMDAESKKALLNYQRLQCELKKSLNQNLQKCRPGDQKTSNVSSIKPSSISSPPIDIAKSRKASLKLETAVSNDKEKQSSTKLKPNNKSASSIMQVFLNTNNSSAPTSSSVVNYAVYSDSFLDGEENTNLMQNCGRNEFMSASSSSAATSEDDEYDGRADKTLDSEEVFLLDRDLNMRKGFDFLNNW